MSKYKYMEIVKQAQTCYNNVKKQQKTGMWSWWSYYFSKALINPQHDVVKIKIENSKRQGDYFSQQIGKGKYLQCAKDLISYVEKYKKMPHYISYNNKRIDPKLFTYLMAKALITYHKDKKYRSALNLNSKVFKEPVETKNEVYNYFIDVFGSFGNTIDGALSKIAGKGYGYYYDDIYTNKEAINRMRNGKGVNCTDSCQVFYNIMEQLIALGKYKKVECLHVKCQGGDGHVRLRITLNDGTMILRDPAAVLDSGNITHNWCLNGTLLSINPSWFMNNLNR